MMEESLSQSVQRILSWRNGKPGPRKIILFPTGRCQSRCLFCPGERIPGAKKDELTIGDWSRIIEDGQRLGVEEWEITGGGDPLAERDKTLEIIRLIKARTGSFCQLTTNGLDFDEEVIDALVRLECDKVFISIEGADAKVHDALVNLPGAYLKIMKALRLFKSRKGKRGRPLLAFNTILTSPVQGSMRRLVALAKKHGVSEIHFMPLKIYPQTREAMKKYALSDAGMDGILRKLSDCIAYADKAGVLLDFSSFPGGSVAGAHMEPHASGNADRERGITAVSSEERGWYEKISGLRDKGRHKEGAEYADRLLKSHPKNPVLLFQKGECLMGMADYHGAIEAMEESLSLRPKVNWVRFSIARCYFLLGKYSDSLRYLDANLKICRDRLSLFYTWYLKALIYHIKNDSRNENECMEHAAEFPEHYARSELPEAERLLLSHHPADYALLKSRQLLRKVSPGDYSYRESRTVRRTLALQKYGSPGKATILWLRQSGILESLCFEPFYLLAIDQYGECAPCCVPGKGSGNAGLKGSSLEEIWHGQHFSMIRKGLLRGRKQVYCSGCSQTHRTEDIRAALMACAGL